MKKHIKALACVSAAALIAVSSLPLAGCSSENEETLTLRISNWEEYIDLGGWDEDELIDIDNPYNSEQGGIIGNNSMIDDFTEWFNSSDYGFKVEVEYSTFGTNEDLYNRLNLGDTYDLVCPSDYMIMKLLAEDKLVEYSDEFLNASDGDNYYTQNVSPYIAEMFQKNGWTSYAACYMWGTTGIVYNPEYTKEQDVAHWDILKNTDYKRKVTVKDNVRDSYFAALGILNSEQLLEGVSDEERSALLNATDEETIEKAEQILKDIKDNVYSFETDSGKADMITGKVWANLQWSGDGVYIMNEAEGDEANPTELWYSVPEECTDLWFDGWVMLKDGIDGNEKKQTAAEAFVNFVSRPDNAVRNMYYIGYTSSIAGETVFDYMEWNYGADEETEKTFDYDLTYFFGEDSGAVLTADAANFIIGDDNNISMGRQLFAQYPPESVIARSVVMLDFGDKLSDINQMWINVRCLDVKDFNPAVVWTIVGIVAALIIGILLYRFRYQIFYRK